MHNSRTGRVKQTHTHTHTHKDTRGTYELNLGSQTEFLILSLGIIVRMWYSDRAPASKPRQDIRSCWSGTLAMQHPDLKCSSGFVVICSSQLSHRGAFQERPLSSSSASHLSPTLPLCPNQNRPIKPAHLRPSPVS